MQLPDLFLRSVDAHGARVAVDVPPGPGRPRRATTTYAELLAMAERVRRAVTGHLTADGEAIVVVHVPRDTAWLYAAQLGVLLAGAAYVCVDPSFPDAHLRHVVADTDAACVVADEAGAARFAGLAPPVVEVPLRSSPPPPAEAAARDDLARDGADRLAYVIYTSGTTGRPKGVLIEHRGAVNLVREGVARFAMSPDDRVAQGSSPAYDSSVEETWLALAAGATVVVLDDDAVRSGPDLGAWLRRERVTVLCPPPTLLRAMDCASPREAVPTLRLCYVGGEPLPQDLADTWGAALHLENGYGPTECTVTVVRGRVAPGEPVTIGVPVPPHEAHVLDEHLRPVADGEPGELCIAGPGLARGYLGQPELTSTRFPTLPGIGRVYRTGDLVARDGDGRLRCLGRIDSQVKVRGYRIELEAIEAALARCAGVREVVCAAVGDDAARELVAHVVPRDPAAPLDEPALADAVRRELPEYMVPSRFVTLAAVPRTIGGKVDRRALPPLAPRPEAAAATPADASPTARLVAAFRDVLGAAARSMAEHDDFFANGGNSLRAAELVSRLRRDPGLAAVAVRDVYEAPTAAGLARVLRARGAADRGPTAARAPRGPRGAPALLTAVQLAFLSASFTLVVLVAWFAAARLLPWLLDSFSLATLVFALPWTFPLLVVVGGGAALLLTVAAKRLLIGRYVAGEHDAWSWFRARHWVVTRLARTIPWSWLEGTELLGAALRLLGARVGQRVHVHRGAVPAGGWDLLELGDDVALARDVDLVPCELHDGRLVLGAVRIGADATFEARAGAGPDTVVGRGAVVRALAHVAPGARVEPGALVDGVPARRVGDAPPPPPLADAAPGWSSWRYTCTVTGLRLLLPPLLAMPAALALLALLAAFGVDAADVRGFLCDDGPASAPTALLVVVAATVALLPLQLATTALLLRWLPAVPAGTHALWSLRQWYATLRMRWLEGAGAWLSGTLFWPAWLRLAGMRIGRDTEVSSIHDVLPERTTLGGGSFLADGVYLGPPERRRGTFTVAETSLGDRTFVGNHVVVAAGQQLPDDVLLGIATRVETARVRAGTSWFGLPAFALPRREVVDADRRLTHEPGPLRYLSRLFWESLRVALPALPAALALLWFDAVARHGAPGAAVGALAVATALLGVTLVTKWLLLGRVRPGRHGLWSCWASRWDFHYVLWQRYARPLLASLEGTLLLPIYLRAMGMRIGRRCVLGDGFAQVVDPDMITIEHGATVHALFQAHSFEDRVLKIDRVRLGEACTVGRGAVVLYGADVGDGAQVAPHSVVMKHERLRAGRRYAGAPTAEEP